LLAPTRRDIDPRDRPRTKLSRKTTAKYLASGETQLHYPHRKSPSQLDSYDAELARWLRTNQQLPRKRRLTLWQIDAAIGGGATQGPMTG
jgi:hypothetical protein